MKRDIKKIFSFITATVLAVTPLVNSKLLLDNYLSQKVQANDLVADNADAESNDSEDTNYSEVDNSNNDWGYSKDDSDANAYSDSDNWDIINGNLFGVEHKLPTADYFTKTSDWYTLSPTEGITNNNSLSISWYKKAHIKNCWPNTDFTATNCNYATTFPVSNDQDKWRASAFRGKTIIIGKAKFNGKEYDVAYGGKQYIQDKLTWDVFHYNYTNKRSQNMSISLIPKTAYEDPQLVKVNHKIQIYYTDIREKNTTEISIDAWMGRNTRLMPKEVVMLPSHHQVVEIKGVKFIPIVYTDRSIEYSGLIKYSNYQKYITHPKNLKTIYSYEWAKQKNGHVDFQFYDKGDKSDFYRTVSWVNSYLKSSKQKRIAQKQFINSINKRYKKYKKIGLTTR